MKRTLAVLLALFAICGLLGAQNKAALQIQCNQSGAQVFVSGRLLGTTSPNLALLLPAGTYQVKVVKSGFNDFDATVNLPSSGAVVQANLVAKGTAAPPPAPAKPNVLTFTLSVTANVAGATVTVNGQGVGPAPWSSQLQMGAYTVLVSAPGYADYSQTVNLVSESVKVNAVLQPKSVQLTVTANVAGAEVYINGRLAGNAPFSAQVPPGSYAVLVRASNYVDFTQNVVVNGATQVTATLQPQNYQLDVDSTVSGAEVSVNGVAYGKTPWAALLPPGSYVVGVKAPGYQDYSAQVTMNGAQKVFASLQPLMASWQIKLPEIIVNKDLKGGHWSQLQVYVDGVQQKGTGNTAATTGQFLPGTHAIRIVSGALATETRFEAKAGLAYTIEPSFGLAVK